MNSHLNLFDKNTPWSDKKAWALGTLWSDGNIYENHIILSVTDLEFVEQFRDIIGINKKVKIYDKGPGRKLQYRLSFSSKKMANDLRRLGCHENKSLTIDYPKELPDEFFWSFFRGLIDGDGCVCIKRDNNMSFSLSTSSTKLKDSLINKMDQFDIGHNVPKFYKDRTEYTLSIYSSYHQEVYEKMYPNDSVPCLYRKKEKFFQGINRKRQRCVWTKTELRCLKQKYPMASWKEIKNIFPKRTASSIRNKAKRLKIERVI